MSVTAMECIGVFNAAVACDAEALRKQYRLSLPNAKRMPLDPLLLSRDVRLLMFWSNQEASSIRHDMIIRATLNAMCNTPPPR